MIEANTKFSGWEGLKIDLRTQRRAVQAGAMVAKRAVVRALKAGVDAAGQRIPERNPPRPGGTGSKAPGGEPLNRTGQLIKSVGRSKARGQQPRSRVALFGQHVDGKRSIPSAVIMAVQKRRMKLELMEVDDATVEAVRQRVEDVLATGIGGAKNQIENLF